MGRWWRVPCGGSMALFAALLCATGLSRPVTAQLCTGDCDSGSSVTVDEVVTGVSIALGTRDLGECPLFDSDGNDQVTVDELIQALNFALDGCPAAPTPTATPSATATPTIPAAAGPQITFFGLANASGTEMASVGDLAGVPIYQPLSGVGFGFLLVVEGRRGTNGNEIGNSPYRSDPFMPNVRPDLQIQANRNLGNGSTVICDIKGPPPNEDPGGGIPGVSPTGFDASSQFISNALNDFGCRFTFRLSNDPCTFSSFGNPRFLRDNSEGQFCTEQVVGAYWQFPRGDTRLTVRWTDTTGVAGPEARIIVRIPG